MARISVFAGICSSASLIGESGRAYVAEDDEDGEAAGPLFIAGFEPAEALGAEADDEFAGEEFAGEVAGGAPFDDWFRIGSRRSVDSRGWWNWER